MKKILAMLLIICISILSLPLNVLAEEVRSASIASEVNDALSYDLSEASGDEEEAVTSTVASTEPAESQGIAEAEDTMTIYFQNNWSLSDVRVYYWNSDTYDNPEWPGYPMTFYEYDGSYDVYTVEVPVDIGGLIFNGILSDGSGLMVQTTDIIGGWEDNLCYYMMSANPYAVNSYDTILTYLDSVVFPDPSGDEDEGYEGIYNPDEAEYIYYSDLFYGYSHYLKNSIYLRDYHYDTQNVIYKVYDDYTNSARFEWSLIKESLKSVFDLKEYAKIVSDAYGLTSFTYNNALDAANVDFAQQLFGKFEVADAYGIEAKYVKRLNDILKVYDKFDEAYDISVMTEAEIFSAMFAVLKDSGVLINISHTTITTIQNDILPDVSKITGTLSKGGDALTAAKVIATGLVLEDLRLEIIDDIISTQTSSDTMLYDGMTRLKNQLKNGFASYFLENYLTEKVLNELADKVVKEISKAALGDSVKKFNLIGAITKVGSWIVFDCIFSVPDIDDLTKQMVLRGYSMDLYAMVQSNIDVFNSPFEADDVLEFESIFTAYVAATNAALQASKRICLKSNVDYLAFVIYKYEDADIYLRTIESAKALIDNTPADERIVTSFGTWTINSDTTMVNSSDAIEEGSIYVPSCGITADFNVLRRHKLKVVSDRKVVVNGNIVLSGYYGSWDGTIYSTLENNGNLYVSKDIVSNSKGMLISNGELYVGGTVNVTFATISGASSRIKGDLVVENTSVSNAYLQFDSGRLEVYGDCIVDNTLKMTNEDDYLLVYGDFSIGGYGSTQLTAGTVELKGNFKKYDNNVNCVGYYETGDHKTVFSGNDTQYITLQGFRNLSGTTYRNQFANLILENTDIVFTVPIYQLVLCQDTVITNPSTIDIIYNCDLNGYSLTTAGSVNTNMLNISSGELYVEGNVNTKFATISGASNIIKGDLVVENTSDSNAYLQFDSGRLEVYGDCIVDNTLKMTNEDDYLLVYGDFNIGGYGSTELTAGTVEVKGDFTKYNNNVNFAGYNETGTHKTIFSGTDTQTIALEGHRDSYGTRYRNQFSNLILKNTDVVFSKPLYQLVLCQDTVISNPAPIKVIYNLDLNGYSLTVGGNVILSDKSYYKITAGKIIFNGTEQQEIKNLDAYNVEVTNPKGIKYLTNTHIRGEYKLNGNPLDNNGYTTYIYNGFSNDQESDYKHITILGDVTLSEDIKATVIKINYSSSNSGSLTIPEGVEVTVDGDILLGNTLTNNGSLRVTGNIKSYYGDYLYNHNKLVVLGNLDLSSDSCYLYQSKPDAIMEVGGNLTLYSNSYSRVTAGKVVFNGSERQTVKYLKAPTIIIDNESEEGIVFESSISPSVLFNHKGNNFTLYNNGTGSTFVDYDGDGLKDNEDPQPTVGNPCTLYFESENTEKGTASIDKIETIGGTSVTVTATPTFKYNFVKWVNASGTIMSTSPQWTFVAKSQDETYTAIFSKRQQPITTQCEGGKINVVSKAEIESEVAVSVTENNGYVYTEGSLQYNGKPIENGSFIMPDEAVVLTAEFVRNENYFLLSDKITQAQNYTYKEYSKESFSNLTQTIAEAKNSLVNNISQEDSEMLIAKLQQAIDDLENKYIVGLAINNTAFYLNLPEMLNDMQVTVIYDNGITEIVSGSDCAFENFDAAVVGEQEITISYNGFSSAFVVEVQKRTITDCEIADVCDQIFDGIKDEYIQTPVLTYNRTGDVLIEGVDYTIEYENNNTVGLATIVFTGIGDYDGTTSITYKIYCEHKMCECIKRFDPTCEQSGYEVEQCTVCGKVFNYENVVLEDLPESSHNYTNGCDVSYYYTDEGANSLVLKFSADTYTESGYDYIYIYDGEGVQKGKYSGGTLASASITVPGDTIRIRLTSDGSKVYYGFSLTSITSYTDRLMIPKTGHSYGEWETVMNPTLISTGLKHKVCTVCGDEVLEEIPMLKAYNVNLYDENGELITTDQVVEGDLYCAPSITKEGYLFDGWYCESELINKFDFTNEITQDVSLYAKFVEYLLGDTNCDGVVSIMDATLIQMYLSSLEEFSEAQKILADTDKDGVVSIMDVTLIQMYIAQLIPELLTK